MAWIKVDDALLGHPKVLKLQTLLGGRADAIGLLVRLWIWASHYAQDGDIGKHDELDVRIGCGLMDADVDILSLLIRCKFIDETDGTLYLHGWSERQGRLIDLRARNAARERERRQRHVAPTDDARGTHAADSVGQASLAKPSKAKTKQQEIVDVVWKIYDDCGEERPKAGVIVRLANKLPEGELLTIVNRLADAGALAKGIGYLNGAVTRRAKEIEEDKPEVLPPERPREDGLYHPSGKRWSTYYQRYLPESEWQTEAEFEAARGPAPVVPS